MARRLFYTDSHVLPLPPGHKFPISKYRLVRDLLSETAVFEFEPAPLASPELIELIHDRNYVRSFHLGTLDAAAMRRIGFPWSEQLVSRTLASVGGTLAGITTGTAIWLGRDSGRWHASCVRRRRVGF